MKFLINGVEVKRIPISYDECKKITSDRKKEIYRVEIVIDLKMITIGWFNSPNKCNQYDDLEEIEPKKAVPANVSNYPNLLDLVNREKLIRICESI